MTDVRYAQKTRRDALTGAPVPGPQHVVVGMAPQSLCGRRIPGLSVWRKEPQGEVCPACLRHQKAGTAAAWRRR